MKNVLITGGNCGLGYECAKAILSSGDPFHVILACRSEDRATSAIATLKADSGNPNISFMHVDLSSISSVRAFASALASSLHLPIDRLVLNAGIGPGSANGTQSSVDGHELMFATNHLGHFLLTNLIRPHLAPDCRIAVVSSNLHNISPVMSGRITISYPGAAALATPDAAVKIPILPYGQTKLRNVYFALKLARRLASTTITVNAFNPG
jgi:NAD(P)-dependent dehydrogenase (short-subunit alcohol dehydrogenase family)